MIPVECRAACNGVAFSSHCQAIWSSPTFAAVSCVDSECLDCACSQPTSVHSILPTDFQSQAKAMVGTVAGVIVRVTERPWAGIGAWIRGLLFSMRPSAGLESFGSRYRYKRHDGHRAGHCPLSVQS